METLNSGKFGVKGNVVFCTSAKRCTVCGECTNFCSRAARCQECYPDNDGMQGQQLRCYCAECGANIVADWISRRLDRPIYDPDNPGTVTLQEEPATELAELMKDMQVKEG